MPKITITLEDIEINGQTGVEIRGNIAGDTPMLADHELSPAQVMSISIFEYIDKIRNPPVNERGDRPYVMSNGSRTPN